MSQEQQKVIKKFEPLECPHCQETIYVGFQSMLPYVTSILTKDGTEQIKKRIRERILEITFKDEQEKKMFLTWLDETLLDESDIEPILKQVATDQIIKIQEDGKNNKPS